MQPLYPKKIVSLIQSLEKAMSKSYPLVLTFSSVSQTHNKNIILLDGNICLRSPINPHYHFNFFQVCGCALPSRGKYSWYLVQSYPSIFSTF